MRLRSLHERLERNEHELYDDREAAIARQAEIERRIQKVEADAQGSVQTIAIGGLREQAFGWSLIVLGVVASGVANIIQSV